MNTYLVGGAVRDEILGKRVSEKDFVVIGETPQSLLNKGFKQVGKDFPVFLHPKTQEEYALARKERKTGEGYHGFDMDTNTSITLEEDLLRRDLTINAIAKSTTGEIIDPYGGQQDLENKVLKHVSSAFVEDPLRVLRVARFQAYLPDFKIAPETMSFMQKICATANEIKALPSERIWLEIEKSGHHKRFDLFWATLEQCGALDALDIQLSPSFIPSVQQSNLTGVERMLSAIWHQESIEGFLALSLPSHMANCIKIIHSQRHALLFREAPEAHDLLTVLKRLDPFRRLDRAKTIIASMPDHPNKALLLKLCTALHNMDIAAVIKDSQPQDRQHLIEKARASLIQSILVS